MTSNTVSRSHRLTIDDAPWDAHRFGVLEDSQENAADIEKFLRQHGYEMDRIFDSDHAVYLAQVEGVKGFILDLNLGEGREEEGLDVIEDLKMLQTSTFRVVYTGHPAQLKRATKAGADVVIEKRLGAAYDLRPALRIFEERFGLDPHGESQHSTPYEDENYRALQLLLGDRDWRNQHSGRYIGIVDGQLVSTGSSRADVLQELHIRFAGVPKLVTKIELLDEIDLSTPLEVE